MAPKLNTLLFASPLAAACAALLIWSEASGRSDGDAVFVPKASNEVLFNPGMGLYLQYPPTNARPEEWFLEIADIAYYRFDWADVNPSERVTRFDEVLGPLFDFWVKQRGKRVAFRFMSENPNSKATHVTPAWVFRKGVPGVKHKAVYAGGHEQTCPVFWDERYLEIHCDFVKKLGAYLDGKPGLEFVDIGSIGVWGEMHLGDSEMGWTPAELKETGFSETRYALAYRRVIDAFRAAFPRTRVFLNVGGKDHLSINDYAAIRGLHFRQDGLTPSGASYDCGEWLYKPYARLGVQCNFEFHSSWATMERKGWDVRKAIEKGLDAPLSYLNTNLFAGEGYRKAPREAIELLTGAARRVGFRFVATRVEHPARAGVARSRPGRLPFRSSWRNDGVAPSHESCALSWSLLAASGKELATELVFPEVPTTRWWPGETQRVEAVLRIPEGAALGTYRLAVAMEIPESAKVIALGMEGRDAKGRYVLDSVTVIRAEGAPAALLDEGFEGDASGWRAVTGVTAKIDGEGAKEGRRSLLISGTAEKSWHYAKARVEAPLVGGSRYALSAWMRVDRCAPPTLPPYLKLAASRADGSWLENFNTDRYDLERLGTWQKLQVEADVPVGAAAGEIVVEKGDNVTSVSATIRLDAVRLEVVEGP